MAVKGRHSHIDLYDDVEKIKEALFHTAYDVKGKAGEIFNDSVDTMKEKSELLKKNVTIYTGKHPFQIISLTFMAGALIGYLLRK